MGEAWQSRNAAVQTQTKRIYRTGQLVFRLRTGRRDAALRHRTHWRRQDPFRFGLPALGWHVSQCDENHPRPKGYFRTSEKPPLGRKCQTALRLELVQWAVAGLVV